MPNTGSSSMRLRIWSNPLRRTSRSDVQDWKVQVVLVAACKTDSRKATNNLEGDKHENEFHSAGLMASLALAISHSRRRAHRRLLRSQLCRINPPRHPRRSI